MQEVELGGERSFIGAWFLSDLAICDEVIAYFKQRGDKVEGQIGNRGEVNKAIKDSIDIIVTPDRFSDPAIARYLGGLQETVEKYMEKFNAAIYVDPFGIAENINIQYYPPGGGYKQWHTERRGKEPPAGNRHLVFMTYLNDVTDEGGTEFLCQKITAQARKGLTLVWPADWTHMHRGIVSPNQEKYVITGWFSFL
jgi:prolyl 4-hydroxylase